MNAELQRFEMLLVEDEETEAYLVKWALGINEIEVELHHVLNGYEALQYLRRAGIHRYPDLILLDLNMPRMNGLECLAEIKQDAALCEIPVVVLTTSYARSDMDASKKLGAVDFITKPMDMYQLAEAVRVMGTRWISPQST